MDCPYCKKEMEKGYIQSRDGLGWNRKKIFPKVFSGTLTEQELGRTVIAYNCRECKKIVIDYSSLEWNNL